MAISKPSCFNLGYLPGGDKSIITRTDSTVTALNNAIRILSSNGIITVMAYPVIRAATWKQTRLKAGVNNWMIINLKSALFTVQKIKSLHQGFL